MSTEQPQPNDSEGAERLPSLPALLALHKGLLQARRRDGDNDDVLSRAETLIRRGQLTGALLDPDNPDEDRGTAQAILDYWSVILFKADRSAPDATLAEFDPDLEPKIPDDACPFVGLDPFREREQDLFFGRERIVKSLLDHLVDNRLLAVVGPSGCGKSSIVLAGLLPALKNGALPDSQNWCYAPRMVPGSNPLANLVRTMLAMQTEETSDRVAWAREQETALRHDPQHLAELAITLSSAPVAWFIDQFEEIFTLCLDDAARRAFLDNLISLVQATGTMHRIILTMRTDFEPFVARFPEFQALFEPAVIRATPLTAAELRDAIEKPAQRVGLKFEAGLVDQLLHDVLGEPAALPLLQFTLLKLWDHRARNRITWQAYNRLGGGRLALARSADEFFDHLIPEDQTTAKRIFMQLVRPAEGLEFTSNRVRTRDLFRAGEASDRVQRVIDKLIAARLVRVTEGDIAADTQIEVAHEALVRNWPRLVGWLEDERHTLRQRQAVADAAERWNASGRDPGALYTTDTIMAEALRVVAASDRPLTEQEAEFIEASRRAQEEVRQAKEMTRQRELEQANKLADAERQRADAQARAAGGLRHLTVGLVLLALAALTAAGLAVSSARVAGTAQATAEAGATQLAAAKVTAEIGATAVAENLNALRSSLGDQLGLIDQVSTVSAENASLKAQIQTLEPPPVRPTRTPSAIFPTATQGTQESIPRRTPTGTATPSVTPTATPNSNTNATATAVALAVQRSQIQATQTAIALRTPSPRLITASKDSTAKIWSMNRGEALYTLVGHTGEIYAVAVDPQMLRIATAGNDRTARIWSLVTGESLNILQGSTSRLWHVAFSPDGANLATAGANWQVMTWRVQSGEILQRFRGHTSSVNCVAYSPDGTRLVSASVDRTGRIWDVATGKEIMQLAGHTDVVNYVSFDPSGKYVLTAGGDGTVRVWDATSGINQLLIWAHNQAVLAANFSPDGQYIVTASLDGTARIWDLSSPTGPLRVLAAHTNGVLAAVFSPSGDQVATAGKDMTARLWDMKTGQELMVFRGHSGDVTSVAFVSQ